jgi:hypothetical protein
MMKIGNELLLGVISLHVGLGDLLPGVFEIKRCFSCLFPALFLGVEKCNGSTC